jgi:cytochrome c-type biogenesis protein CcmE
MRLRKRQRLTLILVAFVLLGSAAALVLAALQDSIAFFVSPTDVAENRFEPGKRFRLGGLVVEGSITRAADGREVRFQLTDTAHSVPVVYAGVLPDLFREGQGIVANGTLRPEGVFVASEVLAKHDEAYMPPEVAEALKRAGHWMAEDGAYGGEAAP